MSRGCCQRLFDEIGDWNQRIDQIESCPKCRLGLVDFDISRFDMFPQAIGDLGCEEFGCPNPVGVLDTIEYRIGFLST